MPHSSQKSNHFVVTVTVIMYYGFILWLEERSLDEGADINIRKEV